MLVSRGACPEDPDRSPLRLPWASPLRLLWRKSPTIATMADQIAALPETSRVTMMRDLAGDDPDRYQSQLVTALVSQSLRLRDLCYLDECLEAADEAVDLAEELAEERPGSYRETYALCLRNLAGLLCAVGRPADALAVATESVEIYRLRNRDDPVARAGGLAGALTNQGLALAELGRIADPFPTPPQPPHPYPPPRAL